MLYSPHFAQNSEKLTKLFFKFLLKRPCGQDFTILWYMKSNPMIFCWKSIIWSVFSMSDSFMKVLEAILAVCGLILQSWSKARRVLPKNKKFGFCFFKDWEWLGWAAMGKILIFLRFQAHFITCLLWKNVVLGHFWPFLGLAFLEFFKVW